MAVYTFGLAASDVASMRLASQDPDTSPSGPLDLALNEAAGEVTSAIWYVANADPSGITEATYPDDYQWLRSLVADGAVYFYTQNATSVVSDEIARRWNGGMSELRDNPARLRFVATQDGTSYVTTHTSTLTQSQIDTYRRRIPTPERRGWGVS